MDTPLMKQYSVIKAKYPGALLLFRVGDFYETFGQDAIAASKVLEIVLTKRGNGSASEIELAGFPHHSLDTYLPRLVRAGHRVAICDQLEDPRMVKGIVKRGVTELVTPGVSFNDTVLERKQNNFLCSAFVGKHAVGAAFLDISTGEFYCAQGNEHYIFKLIQSLQPAEIIFCKAQREKIEKHSAKSTQASRSTIGFMLMISPTTNWLRSSKRLRSKATVSSRGTMGSLLQVRSCITWKQQNIKTHIISLRSPGSMKTNMFGWTNSPSAISELVTSQNDGGVPLLQILDRTVTPMGSRQLRKWMILPLKEKQAIEERLQVVDEFFRNGDLSEKVNEQLKQISDLERLISKVAVGRVNPRELQQLRRSLMAILPVKEILEKQSSAELQKLGAQLDKCEFLLEKIGKELNDEAPMLIHQGGIIKTGVDAELDELRSIAFAGKDYLLQVQKAGS